MEMADKILILWRDIAFWSSILGRSYYILYYIYYITLIISYLLNVQYIQQDLVTSIVRFWLLISSINLFLPACHILRLLYLEVVARTLLRTSKNDFLSKSLYLVLQFQVEIFYWSCLCDIFP